MTEHRWFFVRTAARRLCEIADKISYSVPAYDDFHRELAEAQILLDDIKFWVRDIRTTPHPQPQTLNGVQRADL